MPALKSRNPHRNAPEYADRVNLIKKIKIGKDWRFAPVVPETNGRLKDKVRVNGQVEVHIEGSYFIEWWVSGRRFREATTREDAIECARHKTVERRAIRAGLIASPERQSDPSPKTEIGKAIDDYLRYVKMQRKKRTYLTYRYTLDVLLRASYQKSTRRMRRGKMRSTL